jgi:hypothetical protein
MRLLLTAPFPALPGPPQIPVMVDSRSSRMAGAPAQEEIDEPTGKFLRPRSDIAHLELLA